MPLIAKEKPKASIAAFAAEPARVGGITLKKWPKLTHHGIQQALWQSKARFKVVAAGRRSGKTALLKRRLVLAALTPIPNVPDARFVACAPTLAQAKKIYWADLKAMVPREFLARPPLETELIITTWLGYTLEVHGMDRPERIEGSPLDGIGLDEYANMQERAWTEHIYAALFTLGRPPGWAWMIGVPEGQNHFYNQFLYAKSGQDPDWEGFTWKSEDILPTSIIEAAKRTLDPLTYQQEYEAQFVTFEGKAYYTFSDKNKKRLTYDPSFDLIFCFDFNRNPGVAAIAQEFPRQRPSRMTQEEWDRLPAAARSETHFIKEVFIPRNSNTIRVCEALLAIPWVANHTHAVDCYGDSTGGAAGSAKVEGSDWQLIRKTLGKHFGDRLHLKYPPQNPPQRTRVNSVNSRIRATDGTISLYVDQCCEHLIRDFEGVSVIEGTSGEIDKNANPELTHL